MHKPLCHTRLFILEALYLENTNFWYLFHLLEHIPNAPFLVGTIYDRVLNIPEDYYVLGTGLEPV